MASEGEGGVFRLQLPPLTIPLCHGTDAEVRAPALAQKKTPALSRRGLDIILAG